MNSQTIVVGPSVNFRVNVDKAERAGFGVADVAASQATILDGDLASNMIRDNRLIVLPHVIFLLFASPEILLFACLAGGSPLGVILADAAAAISGFTG